MLLYVNSVDFPQAYYTRVAHYRRIVIPNHISIEQLVDRIRQTSLSHGTISRIVINAHGSPGEVCIGQGLNINNVDLLSRLRPCLQPMVSGQERGINTGILIDACSVAFSGITTMAGGFIAGVSSGEEFLLRMAIAINNKVYASPNIQIGTSRADTSGFEGGFIIFGPSGILRRVEPIHRGNNSVD